MFLIPNFTEIHPVRVALIHAETKTDGRTWRSEDAFRDYANAPKNGNASVDKIVAIKTSDSIHTFRTSHKKDMTRNSAKPVATAQIHTHTKFTCPNKRMSSLTIAVNASPTLLSLWRLPTKSSTCKYVSKKKKVSEWALTDFRHLQALGLNRLYPSVKVYLCMGTLRYERGPMKRYENLVYHKDIGKRAHNSLRETYQKHIIPTFTRVRTREELSSA
jgi:hypothetical protein